MRLWLMRHGHTVWHETGGIAGRTDIGLSARGRAAVEAVAPSFARLDAAAAPICWVSPLGRTLETAALLGGSAATARVDERTVELDFGDWEGSTWDAVHRDVPDVLAAWGDDWVNTGPPGGESFGEQLARCGAWLDDATATGLGEEQRAARDVLLIAHGGTLRALLVHLLGITPDRAMQHRIDPAGVCRFDREASGAWLMRAWNARAFE